VAVDIARNLARDHAKRLGKNRASERTAQIDSQTEGQ
jgi:hypothetical protein